MNFNRNKKVLAVLNLGEKWEKEVLRSAQDWVFYGFESLGGSPLQWNFVDLIGGFINRLIHCVTYPGHD